MFVSVIVIVAVRVRMIVAMLVQDAVEEPSADPVDDQRGDGDDEHDPRARLPSAVQLFDRFAEDLGGRGENQHRIEDSRHRLGPAHPEGEARRRPPDRDPHRNEADREGQDIHQ